MSSEMNSNGVAEEVGAHIRTDFRTRDVVNQAIAAIPTLGLQKAAEFLSAMNVPPEVAIRALAYPVKRKH
ncbi:hypothetical protein HHL21_12490 [Massilia sp. RP-1-19]|uniref:Uncharacterized protein n=1 Tax=Massilia polaris TaxID=2728846 RepID=A0A848HNZ3_9BURK|nr:hypothetical protein [Massilia polaris]NML61880.1 hypothetical protein [Massilia polaris]